MTNDQIQEILVKNGFELKDQGGGVMELNPYVFDAVKQVIGQSIRLAYTETRVAMYVDSPKWLCRVQDLEDYAIKVESQ